MAKDAVKGWILTALEDNELLPKPRSRKEIEALPEEPELGTPQLKLITVQIPLVDQAMRKY